MHSSFGEYHPSVNFLYFGMMLVCSIVFAHPLCRLLSLAGACLWSVYLMGKQAVWFQLRLVLPMMLLSILLNPLFSHEGVTVLGHFPTGSPLTLESVLYGCSMAVMLASVISWFSCYHAVMTSDKFVYLFGRVIPSLSMIFAMALRFVPGFKAQLKALAQGQKSLGRDWKAGAVLQRIKLAVQILAAMVSWSLEHALQTADSMKSRGYGEKGRTAFSLYSAEKRDRAVFVCLLLLGISVLGLLLAGAFGWRYYPAIEAVGLTAWSASGFSLYGMLCFLPMIIEKWEDRKWNSIALTL